MHPRRTIWLFAILVLISVSCQRRDRIAASFDDKITILENNPHAIRSQLDSCRIEHISTEREATTFLLQTLSRCYTDKRFEPDKDDLLLCNGIFAKRKRIQPQIETLYLLAGIYGRENNVNEEVAVIERALELARQDNDAVWMFHLYNYMSDMYRRQSDVLKFIKYQALALQSIKNTDVAELDVNTLMLLGKSYLYTGRLGVAESLLSDLAARVDRQNVYYGDIHELLGVALFRQSKYEAAAAEFGVALGEAVDRENLFLCNSMLALCNYHSGDTAMATLYKQRAEQYEGDNDCGLACIEFYRACAEFAGRSGDHDEETRCMQKAMDQYDRILKRLNGYTLGEAVEGYMRLQDQKRNDTVVRNYQIAVLALLLFIAVMTLVYVNRKKRQAYVYLELQKRIDSLEKLADIQDETRTMILRDLNIARQVSMLKYTQKEKSEKLLKELDRLDLLQGNTLLATQWDGFYHHMDILFDNFYSELVRRYPTLNDKEVQLCCLMKAGFRTEEIASVWMQSVFTVHKYKTAIRKKIGAPEASDILSFMAEDPHPKS